MSLLLQIFAHNPYVAAFSVGQQIATAALSSGLGFGALVFINQPDASTNIP